jgi:hypothetical protein
LQTPSLLQIGAGQTPQSDSQLEQVSPPLQSPSPQTLAAEQSSGQSMTVSLPEHLLSPQNGGAPREMPAAAQRTIKSIDLATRMVTDDAVNGEEFEFMFKKR